MHASKLEKLHHLRKRPEGSMDLLFCYKLKACTIFPRAKELQTRQFTFPLDQRFLSKPQPDNTKEE